MRTKKSLINVLISCGSYLLCMVSTFIIRGMFNRVIGEDYAGIESTFVNAISMLAVVELGIGTGIVYKLYRPIAQKDYTEISKLLRFYKRAYTIIAAIVFAVGVVVAVFIPNIIKEEFEYCWLSFIFVLYLLDTLASYLFANRRALFVADQKNYITTICYTVSQMFNLAVQVALLAVLPSVVDKQMVFALYLCVKILIRLAENISIAVIFKKRYPEVDLNIRETIDVVEKRDLFSKIRALMVHKVAGLSLQATSSMIVTRLVNVVVGGFYGNYISLTNAINTIGNQFFNGITASFGDLFVSAERADSYKKFKAIFFVNYMLYSFFAISFFVISEPFVELWIGTSDAVFSPVVVALMALYMYMYGIRQCMFIVRNVTGEYTKDKWYALVEAVINFVIGIGLVSKFGVIGIPIGNIISQLAIPFWVQSKIVYRDIFGVKVREYYKYYAIYLVVFLLSGSASYALSGFIRTGSLLPDLVVRVCICVILPNLVNVLVFMHTEEFRFIIEAAKGLMSRMTKKDTETDC